MIDTKKNPSTSKYLTIKISITITKKNFSTKSIQKNQHSNNHNKYYDPTQKNHQHRKNSPTNNRNTSRKTPKRLHPKNHTTTITKKNNLPTRDNFKRTAGKTAPSHPGGVDPRPPASEPPNSSLLTPDEDIQRSLQPQTIRTSGKIAGAGAHGGTNGRRRDARGAD